MEKKKKTDSSIRRSCQYKDCEADITVMASLSAAANIKNQLRGAVEILPVRRDNVT